MTKHDKLLKKVLSGRAETNIDFDDLRRLLDHLGFDERIRGSHHVFVKPGIQDMITFSGKAVWPNLIKYGKSDPSSPTTAWRCTRRNDA
jgi:predicted RNA binding protein YcfA (HicA-like mRNA interferase family)